MNTGKRSLRLKRKSSTALWQFYNIEKNTTIGNPFFRYQPFGPKRKTRKKIQGKWLVSFINHQNPVSLHQNVTEIQKSTIWNLFQSHFTFMVFKLNLQSLFKVSALRTLVYSANQRILVTFIHC